MCLQCIVLIRGNYAFGSFWPFSIRHTAGNPAIRLTASSAKAARQTSVAENACRASAMLSGAASQVVEFSQAGNDS